jgi:hypothetical protein
MVDWNVRVMMDGKDIGESQNKPGHRVIGNSIGDRRCCECDRGEVHDIFVVEYRSG